jgi:hypothetical protein
VGLDFGVANDQDRGSARIVGDPEIIAIFEFCPDEEILPCRGGFLVDWRDRRSGRSREPAGSV